LGNRNENVHRGLYVVMGDKQLGDRQLQGDNLTGRQPTGRHILVNWATTLEGWLRM